MYETFCEKCSHFILKWFQPNSFEERCFVEESYKNMQKKKKFENFKSALYSTSGSMTLRYQIFGVVFLKFITFYKARHSCSYVKFIGIVSNSNNIFYDMKQKILTKKGGLFPKFQLIPILLRTLLCLIDSRRWDFLWKFFLFHTQMISAYIYNSFEENCFLEESYK